MMNKNCTFMLAGYFGLIFSLELRGLYRRIRLDCNVIES